MAFTFDGVNDNISYTDIAAFDGAANMTFSFWYYPISWTNLDTIIDKNFAGISIFELSNSDSITIQSGTNQYGTSGASTFPSGTWIHVAVMYDGSGVANADRLKLYGDAGAVSLSFTGTIPATLTANTDPLRVGSAASVYTPGNFRMEHLKIWNASLSQDEIRSEMSTRRPQRTAGLILWVPFDATGATDFAQNTGFAATITEASYLAGPPVTFGG